MRDSILFLFLRVTIMFNFIFILLFKFPSNILFIWIILKFWSIDLYPSHSLDNELLSKEHQLIKRMIIQLLLRQSHHNFYKS